MVGDRTYWSLPGTDVPAPASPVVDLIQGYDEYVMSYSESKDELLDPDQARAAEPAYLHTVLLDGRVVGHWKHMATRTWVTVETAFDRALSTGEREAVDAAVESFGRFLGLSARWV